MNMSQKLFPLQEGSMNGTILLVDDNKMFIDIQKEYLASSLVDILTAHNGLEALDVVKFRRPDLIFMDLQMPRMNGAECCREIKSDPAIDAIPVVMVTTRGNEEEEKSCFVAGCDHFLTKPLDRDQFLDVARRFLPVVDRRERRHTVSIEATFRAHDAVQTCRMLDISVGGAYLATDFFGMPRSVIHLAFTMPDGTTIDTPGRIAWVNRVATPTLPKGFGVKFALLSNKLKDSLKSFVGSA